jgi:hypothetical protein
MQLEFAVLCDYAGHLPDRHFVVVGPALDSITVSSPSAVTSLSLAATVRLRPEESGHHTFRVDATEPAGRRFAVASEQPLLVESTTSAVESTGICNLAVPLGAAFDSPGDYLLHLVIDGQDIKTLPLSVTTAGSSKGAPIGPSIAEIEAMRQAEIREWLELEKATPPVELLRRISNRFSPPAEWFDEADLFEPRAEPG